MSPEYKSPEVGKSLDAKFIRTERCIFISAGAHPSHAKIAETDNLSAVIRRLKETNPAEVDAGFVNIRGDVICISDNSPTLGLPVYGFHLKAREITLRDFGKQSLNHSVRELKR